MPGFDDIDDEEIKSIRGLKSNEPVASSDRRIREYSVSKRLSALGAAFDAP